MKNSTDWYYTDENGKRSEKPGQYGPRFIRIVTPGYSSTGIHGTDAPWTVGGRRSHGCVRLTNENILELAEFVEKGMPIIVKPGSKDKEVNLKEEHPEEAAENDSLSVADAPRHDSEHRTAIPDSTAEKKAAALRRSTKRPLNRRYCTFCKVPQTKKRKNMFSNILK